MTNTPNTPLPPSAIMTLKEVAAYLKMAERTVYLYAQTGRLPGIKIGSAWRFRLGEIEQWLDAQRRITETSTKMNREPIAAAPRPLPLEVESSTLHVGGSDGSATPSTTPTENVQLSTFNVQHSTEEPKEDAP